MDATDETKINPPFISSVHVVAPFPTNRAPYSYSGANHARSNYTWHDYCRPTCSYDRAMPRRHKRGTP